VAEKDRRHASAMQRAQQVQVRKPGPSGDMHDIRAPGHDAIEQRGIAQPEQPIGPRRSRDIGHQFEFVAFGQWNIPRDGSTKAAILDGPAAGMPCEKNLDHDVVATGKLLIEWDGILYRMRDDETDSPSRGSFAAETALPF